MMQISGRPIGAAQRTFVIAEIGVNHGGSVQRAIELAQHAASAGADAVKLQIFHAETLLHDSCRFADYQRERVSDSSAADMLRRYELSESDLWEVCGEIRELGLCPLATPFSPSDVALIERLDLPAIKIASPDLVNHVLLERAAATGRPLLISTGASTMEEVTTTLDWLADWNSLAAFMHCISSYPAPAQCANLSWISELTQLGLPVGYSDHTTEPLAGALAVAAGAVIVEKHLTYDRAAAGPDHAASADPAEFVQYVAGIRAAERMRGAYGKRVLPIEQDVRSVSRQSLVLARDIAPGEALTADALTVQRPGTGIAAAEARRAAGRTARVALAKGTMLQWDMLAA